MIKLIETIKGLPLKKKAILLAIITISLSSVILFFFWFNKTDYQVLYSNLAEEDAGQIIQRLNEQKVPYHVRSGSIMVPSDKVHELRLQLASEGIPQGGGVGFEVFDKSTFTMTDFVQKLNYRRALQGELSRTIKSLTEVEQCRVHLAIPEKSLFLRSEERPKASVLVKLKQGRRLSQGQVQGIVHLVSSSVEGLDPKDVVVVDSRGEMLSEPVDEVAGMTSSQIDYQRNVERELESKIISILEPVAGKNKVRAKVSASIDFTRVEKTEEKYDPDSQVVRSEQRNSEKSMSGISGGVPGVSSNLPNKSVQTSLSQGQSEKKNEIVNYEISKIVSRSINSPGEIKRLSVVALVDGVYSSQKDSKEKVYTPRTEDEIKKFEDMVKNAVGFTAERGDEVRVVNMPFETETEDEISDSRQQIIPVVLNVLKYAIPVLALFLLFFLVIRPLIKALTQQPALQPEVSFPRTVAELEETMKLTEKSEREKLLEWAKANPTKASNLIKNWLEEK